MKTRTLVAVALAGAALLYLSRRPQSSLSDDGALFPKYPDAPPSFYPNRRFHFFAEGRGNDPRYC